MSPEEIRPFPRAEPRKSTQRRKVRKSAILTDTPVRAELVEEAEKRSKTVKRQLCFTDTKKKTKTRKMKKRPQTEVSSEEDENEWFCIECTGLYSQSRPPTKWLQCTKCSKWAHDYCADFNKYYTCKNCNSDNDYDESSSSE